jgi:hypothetical protein
MDPRHARQHLEELRGAAVWLRSATPDSPRYKLWLGDLVEFVRVVFGLDSPQMAEMRGVIAGHRLPAGADEDARLHDYLARLDRFINLIDGFVRRFPEPITLTEPSPNGQDGDPDSGNGHR